MRFKLFVPSSYLFLAIAWSALAQAQPSDFSQLKWLEEVTGERALNWVYQQDQSARKQIEAMPGYQQRYQATRAAASSAENISFVRREGEFLYNFYTNTRNPHGIWRRTTLEEYRKERPSWRILLNLDDIAKQEGRNWVLSRAILNPHDASRALIALSDGGKDEVMLREYDLEKRQFIQGGFESAPAKQRFAWLSKDEILIATDFGRDSMTSSGYPAQARVWKRGQALQEARLVAQANREDMEISFNTEYLPAGQALIHRRTKFFVSERSFWDGKQLHKVDMPQNAWVWSAKGFWVAYLSESWQQGTRTWAAGSVIAAPIDKPVFHTLFEPQERWRSERTEPVVDGFAVLSSRNMQPVLDYLKWNGNGFDKTTMALPASGMVSIGKDSTKDHQIWLTLESPIEPQRFGLMDLSTGKFESLKSQKAFFDADKYVVERFEATSHDGVQIPYTLIRAKNRAPSPEQATLLYGYGGFGIPLNMNYQREVGLNWLEFGGVYVMAHIRGGGEFGEPWRQAALRQKRANSYEDFMAVAQDLIRRGFTTPKRLGIYGASNGGVLVSTVMVRKPQLFGAVVSRVPLTDMLGFTELFAGPSWMEEYGDPSKSDDRSILASWSPLHNLKSGVAYPPMLLVGNQNDDRVHPAHARKLAFRLQDLKQPTLIIEAKEGGHGGRTTPDVYATREAALYTFLMTTLMKD
jgi:prolyl oligopeptidase